MNTNKAMIIAAIIIGCSIIAGAVIHGVAGRYQVAAGSSGAYRIDTKSGAVSWCALGECLQFREKPSQ